MQRLLLNRAGWVLAGTMLLVVPQLLMAQDDSSDAPLGDVARSFRKKPPASEVVIDNDNFSKVVEDAESRRSHGSTMVFSLDPAGKSFNVSSPDVSCNLSFSAKTSSLLNDPALLEELPRRELAKLDGPATIDGDSMQVTVHNGTAWELREVVIGLTILRRHDTNEAEASFGAGHIVPAAAIGSSDSTRDPSQKQPDVTVLLRIKGSAAPAATALFRTQLSFALFPDQEWHWAIVKAKGVPPTSPTSAATTASEASTPKDSVISPDIATSNSLSPVAAPASSPESH